MATRGKRSSGALLALSLAEAAERGDIRCVELKIKAGEDINKATKRTQWTPLHKASAKGHLSCIRALVTAGANLEARTMSGQTALLLASAAGKDAAVRELIAFGADGSCINKIGWTPLHAALSCDSTPAADALLSNGAEASKTTMGGLLAHDVGNVRDGDRFWSPRVREMRDKEVDGLKAKPLPKGKSGFELVDASRTAHDMNQARRIAAKNLERVAQRTHDRAGRNERTRTHRVTETRKETDRVLGSSAQLTTHLVEASQTRLKYQIDAQEKANAKAEASFDLKELFDMIDIDGSGELGKGEIATLACMLGNPLSGPELNEAMEAMDKDGSGEVDFSEFQRFWWEVKAQEGSKWTKMINQRAEAVIDSNNDHHVQSAISEREAKAAFARIDTDRSGTLDLMEFKDLVGGMSEDAAGGMELDRAFYSMDKDHGGSIDFDEFYKWWTRDKKSASYAE